AGSLAFARRLAPTYHVSLLAATVADDAILTAPNSTTRSRTPEVRVAHLGVGVLATPPRPQVALNGAERAPPRYHPLLIPVPVLGGAEGQHPCDDQHQLRR